MIALTAVALTAVALVAVALTAVDFSRLGGGVPDSSTRPDHSTGVTGPIGSPTAVSIAAVLRSQADAVATRDRAGYLADWGSSATIHQQAATTYANLLSLGVARISPTLSLPSVRVRAATWTARVDLAWRLPGPGTSTATSALRYTFTSVGGGRPVISGLSAVTGARQPIWLLPRLEVLRGPRTLVAAGSPADAERVERLLRQAVTAVDRVIPRWGGGLVAYVPASVRQFDALMGAGPGDYRGIAAVTTTVDGSRTSGAPSAIVVNPRVFGGMGPVGAHVVITHEATHEATGAAAVSMPLWVAEGFADYVGIGSVDLPVTVAAKAALRVVRRTGAPQTLPNDAAFARGDADLEATYEEAWLATSLIARTYGRARLVEFYRAVEVRPQDLGGAFERILGTSLAAFTASWRAYLAETAGVG